MLPQTQHLINFLEQRHWHEFKMAKTLSSQTPHLSTMSLWVVYAALCSHSLLIIVLQWLRNAALHAQQ